MVNAVQLWNPSVAVRSASNVNIVDCGPGRKFVNEPFKDFSERKITIPDIQRQIDDDRVNHFYSEIAKEFNIESKSLFSPYLGLLTVGVLDNNYYIVDGQHRYRAYEKFSKDSSHTDFSIYYMHHDCQSTEDIVSLFRKNNNAFKIDEEVLNSLFMPAREKLKSHINTKYKQHIKNTITPNFPHINIDAFIKDFLIMFEKITEDGDKLVSLLEELNTGKNVVLTLIKFISNITLTLY